MFDVPFGTFRYMRTKKSNSDAYEALKIRRDTKRHFERVARENRLPLADVAEVVLEAWDRLEPEEQMRVIRRPVAATA
jgi:hypothetical protein